jgi:hypothetical protein
VKPLCMDDTEYDLWQAANRSITAASVRATRPCSDCPLAFYEEMRAAGTCDGVPGMRVRREPDAYRLHLRRLWAEAQARRRARLAA